MTQQSFDFTRPPILGKAPTSRKAAADITPKVGSMRWRVLEAIRQSPDGLSAEQVEHAAGLSGNTVRPRLVELREAGLIADSGRKIKTQSGKEAVVWVASKGGQS